jgi:hypothetical protein
MITYLNEEQAQKLADAKKELNYLLDIKDSHIKEHQEPPPNLLIEAIDTAYDKCKYLQQRIVSHSSVV